MIISNRSNSFGDNPSVNYNINAEDAARNDEGNQEALLGNQDLIRVSNIVGTIETSEKERFKKLIFRATRGNALAHFRDFDKPIINYSGQQVYKAVYVVMFPDGDAIKNKINKICDSFMGEKYDIPMEDLDEKISEIDK